MQKRLGRYELIAELGRGTTGVVYKARDPLIDRVIAVKVIDFHSLEDADRSRYKARFYQEARAVGRFCHPSLISIHDMGEQDEVAYIVMDLLEGNELQHLLENQRRLTLDEALSIATQAASGLYYAHQHGVTHRDIKPANIMVLHDGQIRIMDFGIARLDIPMLKTRVGVVLGSLLYMSPEQVTSQPLDGRSDIFSLGVVLYQMLTGEFPFSGSNDSVTRDIVARNPVPPSALNREVPAELDRIVACCLAKKPEDRYPDANALEQDLRACRGLLLQRQTGREEFRFFYRGNAEVLRPMRGLVLTTLQAAIIAVSIAIAAILLFAAMTHLLFK